MKNRHDDVVRQMALSGLYRATPEGFIETCRRWNGHHDVVGDWYRCDRSDGKGYRYVSHRMARVKAHRLVYQLHNLNENIAGLEINHLDGQPSNNRIENLELCDASRQSQHAFDTGLNPARGVRHRLSKLDAETVKACREKFALGVPVARMAREAGVTPRAMWLACKRLTWKHVQ